MAKYKFEKEFMFSNKSLEEIQLFLENEQQQIDLMVIRDADKNTVIHHWAYLNQPKILEYYIKYFRRNLEMKPCSFIEIKKLTKMLVNQKNIEGYTALHYAVFKGNISIIGILEKYDADFEAVNNAGQNILHLAARADQVKSLLTLHQKHLNINSIDLKKSTALHWAAFSGSQKVVEYLLAQKQTKIDCQDQGGRTPLHLSVSYGHIKIVRRLLVAGANRYLTNNKDETPISISIANEYSSITKMLDTNYNLLDYLKFLCNMKIKYQPRSRSFIQPLCFFIIFGLVVGYLYSLFTFDSQLVMIIQSSIFGVIFIVYASLIISPKLEHDQLTYEQLANQQKLYQSCMSCLKMMNKRERHCDVCHVCIGQYDHHCFWINNCVGRHNIARFNIFLILLQLALVWLAFLAVQIILILQNIQSPLILFSQRKWVTQNNMQPLLIFAAVIFLILFLLFAIPLLCLILVQMKNLLLNRTTYQRFSKSNQSVISKQDSFLLSDRTITSNKMSFSNCLLMCYDYQSGKDDKIFGVQSKTSDRSSRT